MPAYPKQSRPKRSARREVSATHARSPRRAEALVAELARDLERLCSLGLVVLTRDRDGELRVEAVACEESTSHA